MRIFISMPDQTGSNKTTRISIVNCIDTTELIRQISKQLNINKNAFIFRLKNEIVSLRILESWPLDIYGIKNGSWINMQQNELFNKKQPSISSTSALQKIQENSQDLQGEISNSFSSSSRKNSFFSRRSQHDYSDYYDKQLTKMLTYTRDNQLVKMATLLKQQPDIEDEAQRDLVMQNKNKYILNEVGQCGRNALHWAIHNQNIEIVTFLLLKHADPTIQTIDQYTPLQLAVVHRNLEIVKILLSQPKVDPNRLTTHGTALHLAAYHHSIQLIKTLLEHGANPQQTNKQGKKSIELAQIRQIKAVFEDYQKKLKLRLIKPNITKGNVLKITALTFRTKQRTLMVNPFKGDLILYKQKQVVDHRLKINSIQTVEKINEKSWLMDEKINYLKVIYSVEGIQHKLILGLKHTQIFNKWLSSIDLARTYVNNGKYVSKIQPEMQLIQVLDDRNNDVKVHKRQIQNKKKESPNKHRYSIFDMKIDENETQQTNQKRKSQKDNFEYPITIQQMPKRSFGGSSQGDELRQSQILLGSIINQKNFDSPLNRDSVNSRPSSVNFVSVQIQQSNTPESQPIKTMPNFRKQSADISKVSEFNLQEKKQQKKIDQLQSKKQFKQEKKDEIKNTQKKKVTFSNFEFIKLLGSGAFGQVYLTRHKATSKMYAMKVLNKKKLMAKKHLKYAVSETNILKKVQHPFIIGLHHSFQTPTNLYLALDYCSYGDLSQVLCQKQKLSETTAKFIIIQVILAIQYLHSHKIIYRDLKPQNILIAQDGYIKLIDFGLSKQNHIATSFCGSPAYLSPEMLDKKGHSFPTDIYGIGCVLYEMVIGQPPYFDQDIQQLFDNIKNARLKFPGYLTKQIKSLIARMLQRDVSKRLGASNMKQIKDHQFFKGVNWQKLLKKQMSAPKQIFPQEIQNDYFKLQNKIKGEQLNYVDQQYTETSMFNRIKGFSFSRQ